MWRWGGVHYERWGRSSVCFGVQPVKVGFVARAYGGGYLFALDDHLVGFFFVGGFSR